MKLGTYVKPNYNSQSITYFAPTIAAMMNAPQRDFKLPPDPLMGESFSDIEKALIFHPTAMGQAFIDGCEEIFAPMKEKVEQRVDLITQYPTEKPVCFASAYTSATLAEHHVADKNCRVERYSLFDALQAVGKKSAFIVPKKSALQGIFTKNVDVVIAESDVDAAKKAINFIKADAYDYVAVVNYDYEAMMKVGGPFSSSAKEEAVKAIKTFGVLCDAAEVYWKDYKTLVGFCPDRGAHKSFFGGNSGTAKPEDMNISHYFGLQEKISSDISQ